MKIDFINIMSINEWNGNKHSTLLTDMRFHESDEEDDDDDYDDDDDDDDYEYDDDDDDNGDYDYDDDGEYDPDVDNPDAEVPVPDEVLDELGEYLDNRLTHRDIWNYARNRDAAIMTGNLSTGKKIKKFLMEKGHKASLKRYRGSYIITFDWNGDGIEDA